MTRCPNCEHCTWDPDDDCGRPDHPHRSLCGHCEGRHTHSSAPRVQIDNRALVITVFSSTEVLADYRTC